MLLALLSLLGSGEAPATTPTVSTPTVSTLATGACNTTSGGIQTEASIRVSWSVTNANSTLYSAKLYENGILVSTQDSAASMHYDKTIAGAVERGSVDPWVSAWTYRVDIVRKSDMQVIGSKTSSAWEQQYGGCPGNQA